MGTKSLTEYCRGDYNHGQCGYALDGGSFTFNAAGTGDDVDDDNQQFYLGNNSGGSYEAVFRIPKFDIPKGATISSAVLRLRAAATQSGTTCNVDVYLEDADDPTFPASYGDMMGRSLTSGVSWNNIGSWSSNTEYDSPSIATILQAVIDRENWKAGNAIQVHIRDNGSSSNAERRAYGAEESTYAARIVAEYTLPASIGFKTRQILEITAGGDDGYTRLSTLYNDLSYVYIGTYSSHPCQTFFRFQNANVPSGAQVTAAIMRFVCPDVSNTGNICRVHYYCEDTEDSDAPSQYSDINEAQRTTNHSNNDYVSTWGSGAGQVKWSNYFERALKEVIDKENWRNNNAFTVLVDDKDSSNHGYRKIATYENETYDPVKIYIDYWHPQDTTSFTLQASGDDGCEYDDGSFSATFQDIPLGSYSDQPVNAFFRFDNVTIAPGVTIEDAFLRFKASADDTTEDVQLTFDCEMADDPAAPTTAVGVTGASLSGNNVQFTVDAFDWQQDDYYDSPNFASALQAVIDSGNWSSGEALIVHVRDNSSTNNANRMVQKGETQLHITTSEAIAGDNTKPIVMIIT